VLERPGLDAQADQAVPLGGGVADAEPGDDFGPGALDRLLAQLQPDGADPELDHTVGRREVRPGEAEHVPVPLHRTVEVADRKAHRHTLHVHAAHSAPAHASAAGKPHFSLRALPARPRIADGKRAVGAKAPPPALPSFDDLGVAGVSERTDTPATPGSSGS